MLRPRSLLLAALPFAAACSIRPSATARIPTSWRFANPAPPVVAQHVMVVSEHPLSSDVGAEILRRGGNAIDAAVAVGFALAVVNPRAGNIGGGGFLVYRQADGQVVTLDYRETAPAAATRDIFADSAAVAERRSVIGAKGAGIPGQVAGMWEMHRRFGRLPWRDVVMPAVLLARAHVVDSVRATVMRNNEAKLRQFPATAEAYLPGGQVPRAGDTLRLPHLARTLQLVADSGPEPFYRGGIADLIVAEMRRTGGLITHADLAGYRPVWREPIVFTYRGRTIISMGPPSGGGIALAEMFQQLAGWSRLPDAGSAGMLHLEVEVMRRAFSDRNRYVGDPAFVTVPVDHLTSPAYADSLRGTIDRRHATPSARWLGLTAEGTETTHYSIVDADGNAAALTTTINDNFGNRQVVTGAGFLLNDTMDDFAARPGRPNLFGLVQGEANAIAPGKRPLSSMTPTIVVGTDGRTELIVGSPGGPTIINAVFQVILNVVDHDMTLAEAVYAPRIHHQSLPDSVSWEVDGMDPEVRRRLDAMGHRFHTRPGHLGNTSSVGLGTIGVVDAIHVTPTGLEGVADPRIRGGAAGW
jgi:gamma-glutamyltranspeptidase/glutathione hydrolase